MPYKDPWGEAEPPDTSELFRESDAWACNRANKAATANEAKQRDATYRRKYGKSTADVCRQVETQNYRCANAACENPIGVPGSRGSIDHCHITGVVRGILCNNCNVGLGMLGDSSMRCRGIADYLERGGVWPSTPVPVSGETTST